jgi:transcriptional regulator with XRE-family HTH domain
MNTPIQKTISERVNQLLSEAGITPKAFAESIGIGPANFYKMLNGERKWSVAHLEKIAAGLNVGINALTSKFQGVPVLREVRLQETFRYPHDIGAEHPITWVPVPSEGGNRDLLAKMYGVSVKNGAQSPFFVEGATLICQQESSDQIQDGSLVVYCSPEGEGIIGRVLYHDSPQKLRFQPLNGPSTKELLLDRGQLRMMDKVLFIKL